MELRNLIKRREDVFTFMVHLTRNTEDAKTAKENLIEILCSRTIQARHPKGLFYATEGLQDKVRSVCFCEASFNSIKYLIGKHPNRGVELSAYGVVFAKDFLIQRGANPVFYVNTYYSQERKNALIEAVLSLSEDKKKAIAPFVDTFGWISPQGGIYDFHWEREWRYPGDFTFEWKDVLFGLCEDEYIEEMEELFEKQIKFISPYMNMEEIFGRMLLNWEEMRYSLVTEQCETT
ncbi:MAG: abortive infection system antitoxin AbiGi family protein [Candidatus Omnitrophica bacterium]|nr:abortive infection system antitoxin AbiGi family protein [Candidatus Omnitrophota bacterium]